MLEDQLYPNFMVTEKTDVFLPDCLPYLFLYMDSSVMFEQAFSYIHEKQCSIYTGSLFHSMNMTTVATILEHILFTTSGESILRVVYDENGDLIPFSRLEEQNVNHQCVLSANYTKNKYKREINGQVEMTQFEMMINLNTQNEGCTSFIMEGDSHKLYEVRIHKVLAQNDISHSYRFLIMGEYGQELLSKQTQKKVHFEDENGDQDDEDIDLRKEVFFFYQKFHCLNFYYSMVNQKHGGGLAPSFYRFRICPIIGP